MNHSVGPADRSTAGYSTIYNETASFTTVAAPPNVASSSTLQLSESQHNSSQPLADRYVPRTNKNTVKSGGLAEACGVKVNRVLEFSAPAPPTKRQIAAADFFCQCSSQTQFSGSSGNLFAQAANLRNTDHSRKINTKPVKILDAPGLADEFYANVLDWSKSLDIMAIGLGSCVYAWDPRSSQVSMIADIGTDVSSLRWTDDGCIAIASACGEIQLWDAEQHTLLRSMRGRQSRVAALSWNEYLLSSGGRDGSVWHHDVRIKQHKVSELQGHNGEVCGLEWRDDGRLLATGGNDNLVNIWDSRITAVPRYQLQQHEAAVKALAWCPWQSSVLATGGGSADKKVKLWNASSGACTETLDAGAQVSALHWSGEYREIVASLGYPTNSIAIWSQGPGPKFMKQVEIINAHESRILHSTLSSDGTTLVTGSADENLKFWNLFERQKRTSMNVRSLLSMGRV